VDSEGNVYVTDRDLANVQKFTNIGEFIMKWGSEGEGDGQLSAIESIVVDSSDHIYVADFGNDRIQKFSKDGQFITKWGTSGSEIGQFMGPAGQRFKNL
jgi:tripartite motif-containing protein 71